LTVESAQSLGSDAKPAVFASASAARDFATAAGARLPRQDEYLRMLREASFQVNEQGQIGVDAVNPIKAAENIANQNPDPSSVKEVAAGAATPQKLAYLLGNVREWTADAAAPFGISYMAELIGRQVRLTATAKERSEVVGVRLLVEAR
jgi:formylglycine-generating enzyme required for sulfatase activity